MIEWALVLAQAHRLRDKRPAGVDHKTAWRPRRGRVLARPLPIKPLTGRRIGGAIEPVKVNQPWVFRSGLRAGIEIVARAVEFVDIAALNVGQQSHEPCHALQLGRVRRIGGGRTDRQGIEIARIATLCLHEVLHRQ
jgi:hypothetical protein